MWATRAPVRCTSRRVAWFRIRTVGFGHESGSSGTATVTVRTLKWTNSRDLIVGMSGNGALNVAAGGEVSNTDGSIGYESGSTGTATVTGANSLWTNSGSLNIGGSSDGVGGDGTLNLNDSGLVIVAGTTKLWSTGTINFDGGNLTTASFDNSEEGTVNFHNGTLRGHRFGWDV